MSNFAKYFESLTKNISLFKGDKKSLEEIKNHLSKFKGGSVDLAKQDGIAVITINHPEKRNAISGKMMVDFHNILECLESWTEGKGILLKGKDNNFCSGGDLDFARQTCNAEDGFMMSVFMTQVLFRIQVLPMVSLALIEGAGALGGGAEISVGCDFRVITSNCRGIGFVHPKMGIIPAWGGHRNLVRKIGYCSALDILTTGRILGPTECKNIGLVQEIIPEGSDPSTFALQWLQKRTQHDWNITRAIKTCVMVGENFPQEMELESRIFAPFWGCSANKQALEKNIKHKPS